jgi:hypothetical protein
MSHINKLPSGGRGVTLAFSGNERSAERGSK